MDKNQVFIKTEQGEEAVRQRTRLVQRNLRNVLILVDGYSTVGELSERFGNRQVVGTALAELETSGFIETFERRIVREMNSSGQAKKTPDPPQDLPQIAPASASTGLPELFQDATPTPSTCMPASQPAFATSAPATSARATPAAPMDVVADAQRRAKQCLATLVDTTQGLLELARTTMSSVKSRARGERKPRAPARKTGGLETKSAHAYSWARHAKSFLALTCIVIAAVLALLPQLPLEGTKTRIEAALRERIGEHVTIGALHMVWWPQPGLRADEVKLADGSVEARSILALPDYLSLLVGDLLLREVRIDGLQVSERGLSRLVTLAAGASTQRPAPGVRQVSFTAGRFAISDLQLSGLSGEARLGARNDVVEARVRNADSSFAVRLIPANGRIDTVLTARAWKLPLPPYLTVETLEGTGELTAGRWSFSRFEGRAYEGRLNGKGRLEWGGAVSIAGDFDLKRVNLSRMLNDLASGVSGGGEANVKASFAAKAAEFSGLSDSLQLQGQYDVTRGEIGGFDLAEAVRRRAAPTGGHGTRFEQLSGELIVSAGGCRLSRLRMSAGLLHAGGYIAVSRDKRLDGRLDAEITGTETVVRTPVRVAGTLKDPRLSIAPPGQEAPGPRREAEQAGGEG